MRPESSDYCRRQRKSVGDCPFTVEEELNAKPARTVSACLGVLYTPLLALAVNESGKKNGSPLGKTSGLDAVDYYAAAPWDVFEEHHQRQAKVAAAIPEAFRLACLERKERKDIAEKTVQQLEGRL